MTTETETTDTPAEAPSALETLAAAGDENARAALGLVTADGRVTQVQRETAIEDGWVIGKAAPRDVFADLDGHEVKVTAAMRKEGFRGSQVAAEGAVVDEATLRNLAAAGVI